MYGRLPQQVQFVTFITTFHFRYYTFRWVSLRYETFR
jgi:hypothetical protein